MEIPQTIKLLGHDIRVAQEPREKMTDPTTSGCFNTRYNQICLCTDGDQSNINQTLLHEITEYIDALLGLEMKHSQITAISEGLYQVLRDNDLDFRKKIAI